MTFADNSNFSPIPPRIDPQEIWNSLFGSLNTNDDGAANPVAVRKRSILDFLDRSYETLSLHLGGRDRERIDEHLSRIREMEVALDTMVNVGEGSACALPVVVDTSDYDPAAGLAADDKGERVDLASDAAIPKVGKFMIDMMVMAMACDLTGVGTLQWSDTEAKHTFPWLNLSEHHHFYQHDGMFQPDECARIGTWYSEQHLYLLEQMEAIDMGGHTLLDESVVLFGSELQHPPDHQKNDMPLVLGGRGGGLNTGRWLSFGGHSHNDLLVSILNLFGDTRESIGPEQYNGGPRAGLI